MIISYIKKRIRIYKLNKELVECVRWIDQLRNHKASIKNGCNKPYSAVAQKMIDGINADLKAAHGMNNRISDTLRMLQG